MNKAIKYILIWLLSINVLFGWISIIQHRKYQEDINIIYTKLNDVKNYIIDVKDNQNEIKWNIENISIDISELTD